MNMRKTLFVSFMVYILTFCSFAGTGKSEKQSSFPKIKYEGKGKFRITNGKRKRVVNLKDEIAGCQNMVKLHVIDKTIKEGKLYLVFLVEAAPRCNPQSTCGAAEDSLTLVWLQLNPSLKLEKKKAVIIDDCVRQIVLKDYDGVMDDNVLKIVKMNNGILNIEYEQSEYSDSADTSTKWHLTYNKNTPGKGFVITSMD